MIRIFVFVFIIAFLLCAKKEGSSSEPFSHNYIDPQASTPVTLLNDMLDNKENIGLTPDRIVQKYGKAQYGSIQSGSGAYSVVFLSYRKFFVAARDTAELTKQDTSAYYARERNPYVGFTFKGGKCVSVSATAN